MKLDLTMDEILEDLCYPAPSGSVEVELRPELLRHQRAYSGWRSMYPLTNGQNGSTAVPDSRAASSTLAISSEPSP